MVQSDTPPGGVGTQLHRLLLSIGFKPVPGCQCTANARLYDELGPDRCLERMDQIVGQLRVEANRQGLPFFKPAAVALVRLAIRLARNAEAAYPESR